MESKYWNKYYAEAAERAAPRVPSQFATFVANEINSAEHLILDLGCGNGRDAIFFSNYGFDVLGLDASRSAIDACQVHAEDKNGLSFDCAELGDSDLTQKIKSYAAGRDIIFYARFFIHAITEENEARFFDVANAVCNEKGLIAVEFRTHRDEALEKVTDTHYRRFVEPVKFIERASIKGWVANYFIEGFGLAKFQDDDAHVARIILSRSQKPNL